MADTVIVNTGLGKYAVVIGCGLDYGELALGIHKPCKAVIVSDDNVFPLYGQAAENSFHRCGFETSSFVFKNGEESKSLATIAALLDFLAKENITRSDVLVALGGGVTGDLTGFASAIYLRGIHFIQIPTTVLAAVDSSVGGKTGINLAAGKNLAGAFHQPLGVFCNTDVFASLPKTVFADGMAEIIKHGMIADREMLSLICKPSLCEHISPSEHLPCNSNGSAMQAMAEICRRNVNIKARFVEQDEFDKGIRKMLNFGHTAGHAVEALSEYRMPHGSAVAIGMAVITRASEKTGLCESSCLNYLLKALECYRLPTACNFSAKELACAALHDKKRCGDKITLVIPKKPGQAELFDLPVTRLEEFIAKGL